MKKYIFLFFMLAGSVLISCEKDDDHDDHDDHDHSVSFDFTEENDADYYI